MHEGQRKGLLVVCSEQRYCLLEKEKEEEKENETERQTGIRLMMCSEQTVQYRDTQYATTSKSAKTKQTSRASERQQADRQRSDCSSTVDSRFQ